MIERAAIRTADGKVWSVPRPGWHDAVFMHIAREVGYGISGPGVEDSVAAHLLRQHWITYMRDHDQGFLTDEGEFLDRERSLAHVRDCGQRLLPPGFIRGVLTSEDLW